MMPRHGNFLWLHYLKMLDVKATKDEIKILLFTRPKKNSTLLASTERTYVYFLPQNLPPEGVPYPNPGIVTLTVKLGM